MWIFLLILAILDETVRITSMSYIEETTREQYLSNIENQRTRENKKYSKLDLVFTREFTFLVLK